MQKKVLIEGKFLSVNEIKYKKNPILDAVCNFLQEFLSSSPYFEVQTSGSTGKPSVIRLRKDHMRASARKTLQFLDIGKGDKALLCISPEHIGGIMMLVRWLEGDLDLYPRTPSSRPLDDLDQVVDFAALVPYQVFHSRDQLHKIRKGIIGGGPVEPEVGECLKNAPGEYWHTYGMTETISHVALRRIDGSSGGFKALEGVRFSTDERGCLVIDAPEIGVQGLVTNDIVDLKSPVEFMWRGRYDNVVNSGGIKIYPEEVEKALGKLPYPYFLMGIPDSELGQMLVMVVETEKLPGEEELQSYFEKLEKYHRPRKVFSIPQFLYTPTAKIRRKATLEKALPG